MAPSPAPAPAAAPRHPDQRSREARWAAAEARGERLAARALALGASFGYTSVAVELQNDWGVGMGRLIFGVERTHQRVRGPRAPAQAGAAAARSPAGAPAAAQPPPRGGGAPPQGGVAAPGPFTVKSLKNKKKKVRKDGSDRPCAARRKETRRQLRGGVEGSGASGARAMDLCPPVAAAPLLPRGWSSLPFV